ncbi:MAG: hypothetical protein JSV78_11935 [Phycisphaerales bacterium]|nr:MAG: hypothetical protein JSV78_11935 [Phycisphaerales bacterium]
MKHTPFACALLLAAFTAGCTSRRPIEAWQHRLSSYIMDQGNGDPNVLRDTPDAHSRRSLRPARITFGELDVPGRGLPPFTDKLDVNGVLLGHETVEEDSWFIFLVGVVKHRPRSRSGIKDIRLVAFTIQQEQFCWRVGRRNRKALSTYADSLRPPGEGDETTPRSPPMFPHPTDVYRLEISDQSVMAVDERSGATWRLSLQEEPAKPEDHNE